VVHFPFVRAFLGLTLVNIAGPNWFKLYEKEPDTGPKL
jgi:hypothetical protein